jgi:ribosomal protein S18 acetylase RimI-like enzyme
MPVIRHDLASSASSAAPHLIIRLAPATTRTTAHYLHLGGHALAERIGRYGFFPPAPRWHVLLRCLASTLRVPALYMMECDGQVAGFMSVAESERTLALDWIVVDTSFRGRGIGRQAMLFLEGLARERGCVAIALSVDTKNEPAGQLYRTLGYEGLAAQRYYWRFESRRASGLRVHCSSVVGAVMLVTRWRTVSVEGGRLASTLVRGATARVGELSRLNEAFLQSLCDALWVRELVFHTSGPLPPNIGAEALGVVTRMEKRIA